MISTSGIASNYVKDQGSRRTVHGFGHWSLQRRRLLGAAAWLLATPSVLAHNFTFTDVEATLTAAGGYQIDMRADVDALALGVSPATDDAELKARLEAMPPEDFEAALGWAHQTILRRVRIRFDGEKQTPAVSFPQFGTADAEEAEIPTVLGTIVRLTGPVPPGAKEFTFGASRTFQAVRLTVKDGRTGAEQDHLLGVGEDSSPFALDQPPPPSDWTSVFGIYLGLGFEHILPEGVDHILFVLGLFLLSCKAKPLLLQITAFTVAHSVTLALAMFGVVELPARIVESLIAASIAYVAVENILTPDLKPWRVFIVFGFGLLHGLGFAGVLTQLGLPREEFVPALIAFNVGVEIGQLTVVLLAFLAVRWFLGKSWYRQAIVIPASAAIAAIGLYWAVERAVWGV